MLFLNKESIRIGFLINLSVYWLILKRKREKQSLYQPPCWSFQLHPFECWLVDKTT